VYRSNNNRRHGHRQRHLDIDHVVQVTWMAQRIKQQLGLEIQVSLIKGFLIIII